jgi:glycosyltransferase involved in cell wall biosynthesis
MSRNILFLTLRVFSATGGIEKVCKILGKALSHINSQKGELCILSSHDSSNDAQHNPYFSEKIFTGHNNNRINFLLNSLKKARNADIIIISHVNILPIAWLIKKCFSNKKLIMIAHGIEVWSMPLGYKKKMLAACDEIICVSEFTKQQISKISELKLVKLTVINNCIDPFLNNQKSSEAITNLRTRYGILPEEKVMFTLTRMDANERYKGYDRVIEAMAKLTNKYPSLKYVIGGSYDEAEKKHIDEVLQKFEMSEKVIFTGFIKNEELNNHFLMSDYYIMPSYGEGFGIVFIEAMYFGLPVIAGNKDGSVDALMNGKLGILVDPMNVSEIQVAIEKLLIATKKYIPDNTLLLDNFSYEQYTNKWEKVILN